MNEINEVNVSLWHFLFEIHFAVSGSQGAASDYSEGLLAHLPFAKAQVDILRISFTRVKKNFELF